MNFETNRQRLENFSDEELAIFLCYVIKSGNKNPADFESMLMWLKSPAH